jgi:hypothetical protein
MTATYTFDVFSNQRLTEGEVWPRRGAWEHTGRDKRIGLIA